MTRIAFFGPVAQFDEAAQSWPVFLGKAAKGSAKAAHWLGQADLALAERLGGRRLVEEAPVADYEEALSRALPDHPPFGAVSGLLEDAHRVGLLQTRMSERDEPTHDRTHYDRLWQRGRHVKPALLLHDAAQVCYRQWAARRSAGWSTVSNPTS